MKNPFRKQLSLGTIIVTEKINPFRKVSRNILPEEIKIYPDNVNYNKCVRVGDIIRTFDGKYKVIYFKAKR